MDSETENIREDDQAFYDFVKEAARQSEQVFENVPMISLEAEHQKW